MLRIRGEFKNSSFFCAHVPLEEKSERQKDRLYETKEDVKAVPSYGIRIMNAKLGKEIWTGIAVSTCDFIYIVFILLETIC